MSSQLILSIGPPIILGYVGLTIWMFRFSRREEYREFVLPRIFTVKCGIITGVAAYQTLTAYLRAESGPLPDWVISTSILAAITLLIVPAISALYLIWLDRKRKEPGQQDKL